MALPGWVYTGGQKGKAQAQPRTGGGGDVKRWLSHFSVPIEYGWAGKFAEALYVRG